MNAVKIHPELWIVFVLLFFIFLSLITFITSIRPPRIMSEIYPGVLGLKHENVTFMTKNQLTLRGWFIPGKSENQKTIILLHGYPADKGNILPALSFLNPEFNLLLFDFRYFGESEGNISTAGAKETEDLLAAIRFLKTRGINEVGVWGFSMGGAVALMTAQRAPEIKAIVSESSYAQLDLMLAELFRVPLIKNVLALLIRLWSNILLGIDPKNVSPAESVRNLNLPILIVHSKNDHVIPFKHGLILKEALQDNPQSEFWFETHLSHGELGEDYQNRIRNFFVKHL
ncbi:MAG: alpha/beta fold hydrolase [Candidatus Neomarinimicrobiota bacterium]